MTYTFWSRGRLLGESDLGFVQVFEHVRFGWFRPSPHGERMMSVLTGVGPAAMKVSRMITNPVRNLTRPPRREPGLPADIRRTTAYADLISLEDEVSAMQVEMRDPGGRVVATDDIHIDDTWWKPSLASTKGRRHDGPLEPPDDGCDLPRYQIQVHLRGVPRRCIQFPDIELSD